MPRNFANPQSAELPRLLADIDHIYDNLKLPVLSRRLVAVWASRHYHMPRRFVDAVLAVSTRYDELYGATHFWRFRYGTLSSAEQSVHKRLAHIPFEEEPGDRAETKRALCRNDGISAETRWYMTPAFIGALQAELGPPPGFVRWIEWVR